MYEIDWEVDLAIGKEQLSDEQWNILEAFSNPNEDRHISKRAVESLKVSLERGIAENKVQRDIANAKAQLMEDETAELQKALDTHTQTVLDLHLANWQLADKHRKVLATLAKLQSRAP
mmetsp:Transcript_19505/g.47954  ORF Transcript_19505/g.47954 Transcript_19505/m.47954 type:complete len:118 (-) Transcript_19505:58-411(-)